MTSVDGSATRRRRVLVTGAGGFIGRHLVSRLASRCDLEIVALSRTSGSVDGTYVHQVDLTDEKACESWRQSVPPFDCVIHLAAELPRPGRVADTDVLLVRNLESTRNALKSLSKNTGAFVFASSAFAYDPSTRSPAVESDRPAPTSFYHLSKITGESLAAITAARLGCRAVSLRISAAYGWGQEPSTVLWRFLFAARESNDIVLLGSGGRRQDFVHVDDVVTAFELVVDRPVAGTFNVASGSSVSMRGLAEIARSVTPGCASAIRSMGDPDPQEGVRWRFSIREARTRLGYSPTIGLEKGMKELAMRIAGSDR